MKLSKVTFLGSLVVALVAGGLIAYAVVRNSDGNSNEQQQDTTSTEENRQAESDAATRDGDQEQTEVIDGVAIPVRILQQIEADYPDYIIEDADREVRAGQVYYEIELEHRDPANESEYELTYDADWNLIDTEFDRD